jgi:SAM-dependent methyltransferase
VQTNERIIERCILMTTDLGDLVLDPTCGSGTTAHVAEQWGRRWITIDTSRVALALARARVMGARYPYFLLADSAEGQKREADITGTPQRDIRTYNDVRQGFVYRRCSYITSGEIANNAELDVIWERCQSILEPLRSRLNAAAMMRPAARRRQALERASASLASSRHCAATSSNIRRSSSSASLRNSALRSQISACARHSSAESNAG